MTHECVVARTILIDQTVKEYTKQYPDAICINLGCGLDDRFSRVDNGSIIGELNNRLSVFEWE